MRASYSYTVAAQNDELRRAREVECGDYENDQTGRQASMEVRARDQVLRSSGDGSSFLRWDLCALPPGFGKADGNGLLPAFDLLAAPAAQRAFLSLVHGLFD
jgi:hypothetical protein